MAVGDTTALRAGQPIKLAVGSPVEVGDTLQVGANSNLQVRFIDEAIVALRANSAFKIDDYKYAQQPETDASFFSLLKGGMRTITGLIGKASQKNYAVKTETSTIGIRGTHFNVVHCNNDCRNPDGTTGQNGTFGAITDGRIAVTNQAGEREFGKNEFFFVANANSLPEQLLVPPGFLRDRLDGFARAKGKTGDKGGSEVGGGAAEVTTMMATTTTTTVVVPTDTDPPQAVVDSFGVSWVSAEGLTNWLETEGSGFGGETVSAAEYSLVTSELAPYVEGFSAEAGNVYWGFIPPDAYGGTGEHFAYGDAPTIALPTSGYAYYTRVGGTAPTDNLGNTGTLNSTSLMVDFGSQTFTMGVNYTVGGLTYDWQANNANYVGETIPTVGVGTTATPSAGGIAVVCNNCDSMTAASMSGAFTGKNAEGGILSFATHGVYSTQQVQSATVQVYKKEAAY
jgi:hypothetical protein